MIIILIFITKIIIILIFLEKYHTLLQGKDGIGGQFVVDDTSNFIVYLIYSDKYIFFCY